MLHAFQRNEIAGELFHRRRLAMHDQHFQAGIVIQMRVAGGDHQFVMLMLQLGQFFADAVLVMVVDQGDGSHDDGIRRRCPLADQSVTNQIAKGLGAIGISVLAHPLVELLEKIGIQRHANSAEIPIHAPADLRERFGAKLRILRVVHLDAQQCRDDLGALARDKCFSDPSVDAILVNSRTGAAVGGTGQAYDWALAGKTLFQNAETRKPLIAAGGLSPENVAEAIGTLRPWGVDVVTGVEAAPGRKDPARVLAFIANARSAG